MDTYDFVLISWIILGPTAFVCLYRYLYFNKPTFLPSRSFFTMFFIVIVFKVFFIAIFRSVDLTLPAEQILVVLFFLVALADVLIGFLFVRHIWRIKVWQGYSKKIVLFLLIILNVASFLFFLVVVFFHIFLGRFSFSYDYTNPRLSITSPDNKWLLSVHNVGSPFIFGPQPIHVYYWHRDVLAWPHMLISDDINVGEDIVYKEINKNELIMAYRSGGQVMVWKIDFNDVPKAHLLFSNRCAWKYNPRIPSGTCIPLCDGSEEKLGACYLAIISRP